MIFWIYLYNVDQKFLEKLESFALGPYKAIGGPRTCGFVLIWYWIFSNYFIKPKQGVKERCIPKTELGKGLEGNQKWRCNYIRMKMRFMMTSSKCYGALHRGQSGLTQRHWSRIMKLLKCHIWKSCSKWTDAIQLIHRLEEVVLPTKLVKRWQVQSGSCKKKLWREKEI